MQSEIVKGRKDNMQREGKYLEQVFKNIYQYTLDNLNDNIG